MLKQQLLYTSDFYAWTQDQAGKLRARAHNGIDWDGTAEEIEGLGDAVRNEIEGRLAVLIAHLLKWQFQPERRSNNWKATILEQRTRIAKRLRQSPSLKSYPSEVYLDEYALARLTASGDTGLVEGSFPADCPFTIEDILDIEFYPEAMA
ncbi:MULTISPECIES: DUF29 domain-containing protein [unclassified Aureimonas]|uniref:DUF29 domain-containing protein n=1 Tax=unclassified Aureimonas TaxID=2615206 RepID=UPI0006FA2A5B|nr:MULTISPECIES: DUF29 domain-containing protein [unclassified Aureimonas]KQT69966.1 hypothetical protein ASG62_02400 [Aureimonas sp. Leaf427]KQT75878.1 hypothetical protein ASG54_13815 [Aureimonas sp. Leaf460]